MQTAKSCIEEVYLDGCRAARLACPPGLIPMPGQYLLAQAVAEPDAPLALPIYSAGICPGGFYAAPPLPANWLPGSEIILRGPLGHGFKLPITARRVALVAFGETCARLLAMLEPALAQQAAVVLLTNQPPEGLPSVVEISPLSNFLETITWADYLAIDHPRNQILERLKPFAHHFQHGTGQVFVQTPVPCGGLADCGICAVNYSKGYQLACKDGPVFDLKSILG